MGENKTFYRVCNKETLQGLWYAFDGEFTGFIHNKFDFCLNKDLEMDFDPELVGWLSATDTLDNLYQWFTKEDILKLQEQGWFIHEFEAEESKFYERFQHIIIHQETSKVIQVIELEKEIKVNPYACFGRRPHIMDFDGDNQRDEYELRLGHYNDWERENVV